MREYGAWALAQLDCWHLCGQGEKIDEARTFWSVNWAAFTAFLASRHPLFEGDIAPHEFAETLKLIAEWKNKTEHTPGQGLLPIADG